MINTQLLVSIGTILLLAQITNTFGHPLTNETIAKIPGATKYLGTINDISHDFVEKQNTLHAPSRLKQFPILDVFGIDEVEAANNSIKLPIEGENTTVGSFADGISGELSKIESDLQITITNFELSYEQNVLAFEHFISDIITSNRPSDDNVCGTRINNAVQQFTNIGIDNSASCVHREIERLRRSLTSIQNLNYEWNYAVQNGVVRVGLLLSILKAVITVPRTTIGLPLRFPTCQSIQALNTVFNSLSLIGSIGTCPFAQSNAEAQH